MFIKENVMLAIAGLKSNKMRSLLTMLGIIIGISSVIAIVSIGESMKLAELKNMEQYGFSNIDCYINQKTSVSVELEDSDMISMDDVDNIREKFSNKIEGISIQEGWGESGYVKGKTRKTANISLSGTNEDYGSISKVKIQKGRYISKKDVKSNRRVAVVSDKLTGRVFKSNTNPIGKEITLQIDEETQVFTIVGVYKYEKSMGMAGSIGPDEDLETDMYIPVTTRQEILRQKQKNFNYIQIKPKNEVDSNELVVEIQAYFDKIYRNNKNFEVQCQTYKDEMELFTQQLNLIEGVIAVIAAISLLVGGIGVMNIMLVSVTERTREIGTRKALGAKGSHIRMQFITEAVIICAIGGAIGVSLGIALGALACKIMDNPFSLSIGTVFISLIFSMAIGVFFGYYPAKKAAKLDPIEALRYE